MSQYIVKLGELITKEEKRDAIHIATAPVTAVGTLSPGQHIGLLTATTAGVVRTPIGIVDPFLTEDVQAGDDFWICLYPYSIESLSHSWTHPAFKKHELMDIMKTDTVAINTVQAEAEQLGLSYAELLDGAENYIKYDDYMIDGGRWDGEGLSDTYAFWNAYESITGTKVDDNKKNSFFSCSC